MPNNWKKYKLEEITDYINRGVSPSYNTIGIPVVNQKCIREGRILSNDIKYHDLDKRKVTDEKLLKSYDILICSTGTGTLGRVGQLKEISDTQICDSHVTIVRPSKLTDNYGFRYKKPVQPVKYQKSEPVQPPKAEVKAVKGSKKYFINETEVDEPTFNKIAPIKSMKKNEE